jgi:nicotinate phosphoribosyltransferase
VPTIPGRRGLALFTDLYELTMLQAYVVQDMHEEAVFSLFVRRLPPDRRFLLACGLDTLLGAIEDLQFEDDDLAYLDSLGLFQARFLDWLSDWRFSGEVHAVPEGTPMFSNEPLLEVTAPLPQAQLIETLVMNQVHLQTVLASKAVRLVQAAGGRPVIDFGARRTHGVEAAVNAARAFHVAGVAATSNVLAGRLYGIPVTGTMAHSYIQAHDDEYQAFARYAGLYPETILLVDTYDTLDGVGKVIRLAAALGDGFRVRGIRLDSGDLGELARAARARLDDAGLQQVSIFASGGLDEHAVAALVARGAPIDGFGVGTSMGVARDAPDLDLAYKLCEYAGRGRIKLSTGKPILPGRKQVFRASRDGIASGDTIARAGESLPGRPLLRPVMAAGRRLPGHVTDLDQVRAYAAAEVAALPPALRSIEPAQPGDYPVEVSARLAAEHAAVSARIRAQSPGGRT